MKRLGNNKNMCAQSDNLPKQNTEDIEKKIFLREYLLIAFSGKTYYI